ncbi:MAG: type II toxin-antitoxin system death-on-curing family toxin [Alphaproteobacteria bacterium]|nr:MAG: type II toxin-antitoxin system death-on-curing family toxin [Alphaproteobacteria bacterium]
MTTIYWIEQEIILAVHEEQLSDHGGAIGIRNVNLLDSALARPHNLSSYGNPDIAGLAASYAYGIIRNHPFVDGNKRTALVAAELFLALNGYELIASDEMCVLTIVGVADKTISEAELHMWISENIALINTVKLK